MQWMAFMFELTKQTMVFVRIPEYFQWCSWGGDVHSVNILGSIFCSWHS